MADDNDDSWLYGANHEDSNFDQKEKQDDEKEEPESIEENQVQFDAQPLDEHNFEEAGEDAHMISEDMQDGDEESNVERKATKTADSDDDDEDDDDDDDINVVIGDIKSGGTTFVKGLQEKQKAGAGSKFSIEEFESVGSIAGQPATEFALDSIEDKPWRKPGADITDYFNYGFNEETWRAYCERQKRLRINESCVGLTGLTVLQNPMNVDQKQPGINIGIKRLGRQKPPGTIDVIGASSSSQMNNMRPQQPRENVIQVMTADRREYSRTVVGNQQGGVGFNAPNESYYNNDQQDAYNYGYEPTQEQQWDHQNVGSNWAPREIKELTGIGNQSQPMMNIPPPSMHVPNMMPGHNNMMPQMGGSGSSLKPLMNDPRDRRDQLGRGDNRNYDRKRMRSNSREREQRERKDRRERSPDRSGGMDRRKRRSRSREKESSRRETMRSKSRERKRSKSKDRSKDRKSDDRRAESKAKSSR